MERSAIISIPGIRKKDSSVQVLQVHKASFIEDQEDDYLPEGIYVCHVSLNQILQEERWINGKEIDAVIVGRDCSMSDIVSLREIATRKVVPLIFHTLKFDWKAKEIAIECRVDEYHIGFFDQHFIKRIRLIRRVKSLTHASPDKQNKSLSEAGPSFKFWWLKRSVDIVIAALVILSLVPILLVIVPLLMLETNGSILSSSKRVGKNYRVFDLYKFTCVTSGDSKKIHLIRQFLKKAHLVGLPQILNVLAGDMSFVGNYPVHQYDAEQLTKDGIAWRFFAPVGIVGLWRFNSNKTGIWDLEYARTCSIWLDIKILFAHVINIVTGQYRSDKKLMFPSLRKSMPSIYKKYPFHIATN